MEGKKKILAISFEGGNPAQGIAGWDGKALYVTELNEMAVDPYVWMENMMQDIQAKSKAGWVVLVEDRTSSFPPPATSWNFDAVSVDGRTNLQSSLDWYFALQGRGSIILDPKLKKYTFRLGGVNDIIEAKNDEKGRLVYSINWQEFSCGHRALLMCVAGAVMEEPLSERWLATFANNLPKYDKPPIWPVFRTMKELWKKQQLDLEERIDAMEASKHV